MKSVVYAVVTTAVLGAGVTAQQAGQAARPAAQTARPATPVPTTSGTQTPAKMAAAHAVPVPAGAEAQTKLVAQYCAGCHSEKGKAGGLSLVGFDAAKADRTEVAEKMIRKLRAGMMPPPGARRPGHRARRTG